MTFEELMRVAADLSKHLREAGFTDRVELQQVLAVAEEAGEFVGAFRRWVGMARRGGTFEEMSDEAADVIITMFLTAYELHIDLTAAISRKLEKIYARGWRE